MTDIKGLIEDLRRTTTFKPSQCGNAEHIAIVEEAITALRGMGEWRKTTKYGEGNAIYGYHPDWVHEDVNPDGIRELSYCGDHYISSYYCMRCDEWHDTDATFDDTKSKPVQPLFVMDRFPINPPSPRIE